jgi:hypothetical protein
MPNLQKMLKRSPFSVWIVDTSALDALSEEEPNENVARVAAKRSRPEGRYHDENWWEHDRTPTGLKSCRGPIAVSYLQLGNRSDASCVLQSNWFVVE